MKIIDLSQTIKNKTRVYPGDPEVEIKQSHTIDKEGWRLKLLKFGSHTGTHVDAFSHMDEEGLTLDEMPLEKFFGKAQVVDVSEELPTNTGLVFSTKELSLSHFAKIENAKPPFVCVGADCNFTVELERRLLRKKIVTFTDLVNIDKLPRNKEFIFYGFPLKIKDGDGSPIRAIAIV